MQIAVFFALLMRLAQQIRLERSCYFNGKPANSYLDFGIFPLVPCSRSTQRL
ncbi:hypothetical protein PATSB16_27620 [Pandoraea thiooxydans]|nr:hypothetical protein PATSB16_27620 [Pandoraea thiooxydans]